MVPTAFVTLGMIPLTPNGKIDRQTLSVPEVSRKAFTDTIVLPSTPEEEQLLSIWCKVLGLTPISMHDNFFELGGQSLQALQLISQISVEFQRNIPVHALLLHPTVTRPGSGSPYFPLYSLIDGSYRETMYGRSAADAAIIPLYSVCL